MRVLVFEPVWAGHRLHFVSMLLPGLVETGASMGRTRLASSRVTHVTTVTPWGCSRRSPTMRAPYRSNGAVTRVD